MFKIIDEHAKWIKEQQEDKVISLNYESYKNDLEISKSQNDKLKEIENFISPYYFEFSQNTLDENEYEKDMKEQRDRWIEILRKDIYVNEAINLLKELSEINSVEVLSQLNIN